MENKESSKRPSKKTDPKKSTPRKTSARPKKAPAKKHSGKDKEELRTLSKILKQSRQHDSVGHAIDTMSENLNSFILLGYSFNGDPITAVAAQTPQEYDALYSRAVQFVQQTGSPKSNPPPSQADEED